MVKKIQGHDGGAAIYRRHSHHSEVRRASCSAQPYQASQKARTESHVLHYQVRLVNGPNIGLQA